MAKYKLLNAVQCPQCLQVLVSINRHDYQTCRCTNRTMIDGGFDYGRCGWQHMKPKRLTNLFIKLESK